MDKALVFGTHGTALSTFLHQYDENFGLESFLRIIDKTPWTAKLTFQGNAFQSMIFFDI